MDNDKELLTLEEYLRVNLRHLVLAASVLSSIQRTLLPPKKLLHDGLMITPSTVNLIRLSIAEEIIRNLLLDAGITPEEVKAVVDSANLEIDMMRKLAMN